MNIFARYKKLTFWNKFAVWAGISSIIGVPLAIFLWIFPYDTKTPQVITVERPVLLDKDKSDPHQQKANNNTASISNTRPVVDIFADRDKNLHIKNLGRVDISDIQIFITGYKLKAHMDKRNHFILDGEIESTIGGSGPLAKHRFISKGSGEYKLDLTKLFPSAIPFFSFEEMVKLDSAKRFDEERTVYCIRILFRNDLTKQHHVHYLLTNTYKQFVDTWDPRNPGAGGYNAAMGLSRIRDLIKDHQKTIYDDKATDFL